MGIEPYDFFLLYKKAVLCVTDTTRTQTILPKLDRVQKEAMRVILENHHDTPSETMRFMLYLPPTQTRQKVEQVKAYFSAVENRHNPLHEAVEDTKGCRRTGKLLDGSSTGLSTASMPADSSSKPRNGKDTQTDSGVSTRHSCQKTRESTVENGQQENQNQRSSFSFKKTVIRKTF